MILDGLMDAALGPWVGHQAADVSGQPRINHLTKLKGYEGCLQLRGKAQWRPLDAR